MNANKYLAEQSNGVDNPADLVPAVEKAVHILELLESTDNGLNLTDISDALNISKSTSFRILNTLKYFGYVEQEFERGVYTLGHRLLSLANAVKDKLNLAKVALPFMEQLTKITGETTKLGVLRNGEAIVIARVKSSREMSITTDVGRRFPIHAGGASKMLFAHLPEEEIERIISKGLKRYTSTTITDPEKLRSELKTILRQGFAEDNGECIEGIKAIACPIFDYHGRVVAALSIPYLPTRANDNKRKELLVQLFACARDISEALGHGQ